VQGLQTPGLKGVDSSDGLSQDHAGETQHGQPAGKYRNKLSVKGALQHMHDSDAVPTHITFGENVHVTYSPHNAWSEHCARMHCAHHHHHHALMAKPQLEA
jgi:hypothetical protein